MPRSNVIPRERLCIEMMGYSAVDLPIGPGLCDCIGSLVLCLEDLEDEIVALAGLLNACRNLKYLELRTPSISGLRHLLDRPLASIRDLLIYTFKEESHEFSALLEQLPNLKSVKLDPPLSEQPFDSDGPQHCAIRLEYCDALPMVVSRRWTARNVDASLYPHTLHLLENVDWAAIRAGSLRAVVSLRLRLNTPLDTARVDALALVTACPALRDLYLAASGLEIRAMLPSILSQCPGLRALDLQFWWPTAHADLVAVSGLLLDAIAKAHALRELQVSVVEASLPMDDLILRCRQRRVACTIREGYYGE